MSNETKNENSSKRIYSIVRLHNAENYKAWLDWIMLEALNHGPAGAALVRGARPVWREPERDDRHFTNPDSGEKMIISDDEYAAKIIAATAHLDPDDMNDAAEIARILIYIELRGTARKLLTSISTRYVSTTRKPRRC